MSRDEPRAILRDDRALILVPNPLRLSAYEHGGGDWITDNAGDVEMHLSTEDYLTLVQQMPSPVKDFVDWIIALDDVEGPGAEARRTVTMSNIIRRAKDAMGVDHG